MYNASLKTGFNKSIKKRKLTLYLSVTINKSRPAMIPQKKKAHNYIAIFCQTTKRVIKKIKSPKYLSCMQMARPVLLTMSNILLTLYTVLP